MQQSVCKSCASDFLLLPACDEPGGGLAAAVSRVPACTLVLLKSKVFSQ